jgi:vancomycin permeability regulator SanA
MLCHVRRHCDWPVLLLAILGCTPSANEAEAAARETFAALQTALKAKDAEKVWDLLDGDSQADAEREAKAVREAYTKASTEEKAEQEKQLSLPGTELAALTGKGYLKTKRFLSKYEEIPESKIDKVTVQGDKATINYTEPDEEKEKLTLVRQDNKWKVSLSMPKAAHP